MQVDLQWFLYLFLGGFTTIWTFRYFSNSFEKYSEFEWFASSAFWGLWVIGTFGFIQDAQAAEELLMNPLATGLVLSIIGIIFGYIGSRLVQMKVFRHTVRFLGKGGKD